MTPDQCRAARMFLDLSRDALAEQADVSRATLARFETGQKIHADKHAAIKRFFERRGFAFLDDRTLKHPVSSAGKPTA